MKPNYTERTIVIGAGLSGLAAAQALHPVAILEASARIADPRRARHPQLRLNIHRQFAGLPGKRTFAAVDTELRSADIV